MMNRPRQGRFLQRRLRYPHWTLDDDRARGSVRITRTPAPFVELADLEASVAEMARILDSVGRSSVVLLVDLRPGPMRTDSAFEYAMIEARAQLLRGIGKVAVVVATPLGRMQVSRHQRNDGITWATFNDENAALDYLGLRKASGG
jgi:hypothetical protein